MRLRPMLAAAHVLALLFLERIPCAAVIGALVLVLLYALPCESVLPWPLLDPEW